MSKYFGPSTLVAAAFIGPGTLTTCTLAGVRMGYDLLWVLVLSIGATVVLQEMAARLGLVTGAGLGEALSRRFPRGPSRWLVLFLCVGAVIVGNAAYEAGNLAGGVLGLEVLLGPFRWWPVVLGAGAGALLFLGSYRWIERALTGAVLLMSGCFLATTIILSPDWAAVLGGFVPRAVGPEELLLVAALIGTTIVPYNLFLHASTVSQKYSPDSSLRDLRIENAVAILLGGLVSLLIVITAAGARAPGAGASEMP